MRSTMIALMLAPPVIGIALMLLLRFPLKKFQRTTPSIRTQDDLHRLKKLAALQMYCSIVAPELIWAPFVVWIVGKFVTDVLTWMDLLTYGVIPFLALGAVAFLAGGPAEQVQSVPVDDPSLQKERDHIIDVWLHRRLPKF